jgi:hypothetical protein
VADYAVAPASCVAADPCPEPQRADPIRPPPPSPESRILNPRDNLVTLIAVTRGEEAFTDSNNDGKYDEGEDFEDLTEPFVDMNDSGTREEIEPFIDTNDNGVWDGKNGTFDASTLIWVEEKILWTGVPLRGYDDTGARPTIRMLAPVGAANLTHHAGVDVSVVFADPWFNSMAKDDNSDFCEVIGSDLVVGAPAQFDKGIRTYYPAANLLSFRLTDAHDPAAEPPSNAFASPIPYASQVACTFTGSPIDGPTITIKLPGPSGNVQ